MLNKRLISQEVLKTDSVDVGVWCLFEISVFIIMYVHIVHNSGHNIKYIHTKRKFFNQKYQWLYP